MPDRLPDRLPAICPPGKNFPEKNFLEKRHTRKSPPIGPGLTILPGYRYRNSLTHFFGSPFFALGCQPTGPILAPRGVIWHVNIYVAYADIKG